MGLMEGKNVVIFGVANKRSIAWGIAQALQREGANLALGYQNERMGDAVKKLAGDLERPPLLLPCDVTVDGDIERFFEALGKEWDGIDGLVHSIAFAKREELGGNFRDTSWDGYALAQQVSAWSLIGLTKGALPMMEGRDASVVCLSYYGAEKVVTNYNVMGVVPRRAGARRRPRGKPDEPRDAGRRGRRRRPRARAARAAAAVRRRTARPHRRRAPARARLAGAVGAARSGRGLRCPGCCSRRRRRSPGR